MIELIFLIVVGGSIWVFIDAPSHGLSWTWGLGCLALFVVAFPWYLAERSKVERLERTLPATPRPAPLGGRWEPDPRDPQRRERWREGERWTKHIRDRGR